MKKTLLIILVVTLVIGLPIYDVFFYGKPEVLGITITTKEVDNNKILIKGELTNEVHAVLDTPDFRIVNDEIYITVKRVRKSFIHNNRTFTFVQDGDFSWVRNVYIENKFAKRVIWSTEYIVED